MRALVLLTLLTFLTLRAGAADGREMVVTLERDGQAARTGEVCRFAAGHREHPIRRWLSSQETVCVPAGSALDVPEGLWNVFGRTADGVSTEPLLVDGSEVPPTLKLRLVPAATLRTTLGEEQGGVLYAPLRGVAYPVTGSAQSIPAGEPLWLIAVEKKKPVAVFTILPGDPGTERAVQGRGAAPAAILGWLRFRDEDRAALANEGVVVPPKVWVTQGGVALESEPLPAVDTIDGAMVLVRGVAAGETELEAGGRGWLTSRRRANVLHNVTVVNDPLALRPAAAVIVQWAVTSDLRRLYQTIGKCKDDHQPPELVISVSSCTTQPRRHPRSAEPPKCEVVRQEKVDPVANIGELTLEDLPPGMYQAEMRYGHLPAVTGSVRVSAFQRRVVSLHPNFWGLYGSVTRGGEPLGKDATITFPDGSGFALGETSEYEAALQDMFETDARIDVATCDGSLKTAILAEGNMQPRSRYDIEIPGNLLAFDVTDTFTQEPLPGAVVKIVLHSKLRPRRPVLEQTLTAEARDGHGARAMVEGVPEREIIATISRAGYQKRTLDPFTMPRSDRKIVDVQLVPLRGSGARIVSPRPFEEGSVLWFSAAGEETERAELWPDGTFVYASSHGPDETMAVVSRSHPLWVTRAVSASRGSTLEIPFPDAPPRSVEIHFASGDPRITRMIGVVVRGIRIPPGALRAHQSLRELSYVLRGTGPLPIRDLAETGPIDILLGPRLEEVPHRTPDPFALPTYANVPKKRLEKGEESVEFE